MRFIIMDYYKKRKFATSRIEKLMSNNHSKNKIILIILKEFGLSKKFVEETYHLISQDEVGNLEND